MKKLFRIVMAITLGLGTLLIGQLAIENSVWWLTGGTATFDDPALNALKIAVAAAAGIWLAVRILRTPSRRRALA